MPTLDMFYRLQEFLQAQFVRVPLDTMIGNVASRLARLVASGLIGAGQTPAPQLVDERRKRSQPGWGLVHFSVGNRVWRKKR